MAKVRELLLSCETESASDLGALGGRAAPEQTSALPDWLFEAGAVLCPCLFLDVLRVP